jgi:D-alanyl-D-alanine carboxypeptidase (penicillin-binding protein 5/6)
MSSVRYQPARLAFVAVLLVLITACRDHAAAPPLTIDEPLPMDPSAGGSGPQAVSSALGERNPTFSGVVTLPATAATETQAGAPAADPPPRVCAPVQLGAARPPTRLRQTPPPLVGAAGAVVIDAGSGVVLWGKDEHKPMQPASTTKIVTAFLAVERGDLDEPITVAVDDRRFMVGSRMGLNQGDTFTLRDLLYGLMLPSGNDAAIVIAQHLAGSEAAFADLMTRRMCDLGLVDSSFINASGLGRGESNLASAFDLAQVSRYAMELPAFAEIVRARTWTAKGSRTISFSNLNELVHSYAGADGVKIGWTPGAGNTIVGSATRNGHRVIVALLNTPNRAAESAALLNWAFSTFEWKDER